MEAEINMVLDIGYAVECILLLTSHKWYVDIRHLAYVLKWAPIQVKPHAFKPPALYVFTVPV